MRINMITLSVASILLAGPEAVTLAAPEPQTEGPPMYGTPQQRSTMEPNSPGASDASPGHHMQEERSGRRLQEPRSAERYPGGTNTEPRHPMRSMQDGSGPLSRSGHTPDTRATDPDHGSTDYNNH